MSSTAAATNLETVKALYEAFAAATSRPSSR